LCDDNKVDSKEKRSSCWGRFVVRKTNKFLRSHFLVEFLIITKTKNCLRWKKMKTLEGLGIVSVLCNQILDSMALLGGSSVQYCVAVRVQTYPL